MPDRSCLTGDTAALDGDQEVEFVQGVAELERLPDDHPMDFIEEMRLERPTVYLNVSGSGSQKNPGRGRLPPARTVILN